MRADYTPPRRELSASIIHLFSGKENTFPRKERRFLTFRGTVADCSHRCRGEKNTAPDAVKGLEPYQRSIQIDAAPFLGGAVGCVENFGDADGQVQRGQRRPSQGHGLHEVGELIHIAPNDLIRDKGLVPAQLGGQHLRQLYLLNALLVGEVGAQQVRGGQIAQ